MSAYLTVPNELPPPPPGKTGWPWTVESNQPQRPARTGHPLPCITIVTPSYNQGSFIEETIRSVLFQGYPHLEYIIMDGGSTDNTVEIIKKYERWITHWVSERDRGQAHAVNKGWEMAAGELLGWVNSDDLYLPRAFHRVALAYQEGGRGLIYGDCQATDENGEIRTGVKRMADYSLSCLLSQYTMPQPAVFVTKSFALGIGMLDQTLQYALDFDFYLRAWSSRESQFFHYIPKILSVSREHRNSKCSGSLQKGSPRFIRENIYVLNRWWRSLETGGEEQTLYAAAFSLALFKQARFLLTTRDNLLALSVFAQAFRRQPLAFIQNVFSKALGKSSRLLKFVH